MSPGWNAVGSELTGNAEPRGASGYVSRFGTLRWSIFGSGRLQAPDLRIAPEIALHVLVDQLLQVDTQAPGALRITTSVQTPVSAGTSPIG